MSGFFGIMSMIVILAMVGVAVSHSQTASIISAIANGFANSIKAAKP